jgi:hypothetical protein
MTVAELIVELKKITDQDIAVQIDIGGKSIGVTSIEVIEGIKRDGTIVEFAEIG